MTLGLVPKETTVTCDGKERPLSGAANPDITTICARTYPTTIKIRHRENGSAVVQQNFHTTYGGLRYTITGGGKAAEFLLKPE